VEKAPRKSTAREAVENTVEAGLNLAPIIGGPLAVAFTYAVSVTFNRRMQQWLDELADAVSDLQQQGRGIDLVGLATDDDFIDAVASATRAAERTHQRLKIDALRNAVLNSALPGAPDTDTQLIFLRWVDEFTAAHLQMLTLWNDPIDWYTRHGINLRHDTGSRWTVVEEGIPQFAGRREFCDILVHDLAAAGLLAIANIGGVITGSGMYVPVTTQLGKDFIAFVTDPRTS
jgi:hypothetical protein